MRRTLALLIAGALSLAACASDSDEDTAAAGDPHDPRPARCDDEQLAGDWDFHLEGFGTSVWTLALRAGGSFATTETGLGNSTGEVRQTSHLPGTRLDSPLLTGDWTTSDSAGTLELVIEGSCDRASGTVTFTEHHGQPSDDTYGALLEKRG